MPFERPSLPELIARIQADMDSRLDGQPWLRRRLLAILARMEGGVAHGLYGYLDWLARQIMPDTAEAEHLERWGTKTVFIDSGTYLNAQRLPPHF